MAQAVTQLFPGAKFSIGPADRERLLLRLRPARMGARSTRTTWRRSTPGCARSSLPTSRSCAPRCHLARRSRSSPTSPTSWRSSSGSNGRGWRRRARRRRGRRRRHDQRVSQQPRVRRPVQRPARPVDRSARALRAAEGRRGVLARQRARSDAAAHLRHGLGVRRRTAGPPRAARRGRQARPSPAGHRARPAQLPERARRRPRRLASEGRHRPQADGGLQPPAPRVAAATSSCTRRTSPRPELFETSGHLDWYADGMYPPMEMDNGTYYMKPMNCPMHCLIFRSRQRSYRELPLRLFELGTVYRYERAGTLARTAPRTRADDGRQPHLLHSRSSCRTRSPRCSTSCSPCCARSASTTSRSTCRPRIPRSTSGPTRSGRRRPRRCGRRSCATGSSTR